MSTATKTAYPVASAADFALSTKAYDAQRKVDEKKDNLADLVKSKEMYEDRVTAHRNIASGIRGLILTQREDEFVAKFPSVLSPLNDVLYTVKRAGEDAKYYVDDYTKRIKRLEAEIDGNMPKDDSNEI